MYKNWDHRNDVAYKIKMILTGRGHFYKNRKIGSMVNELYENYNIGRNSLLNHILIYYFTKDLDSRYDENRSSFELYLVGICFYWLRNFLAKCRRSELSEREIVRLDDGDGKTESNILAGCLDSFGTNSQVNPETLYCALELKNIIEIYYDDVDMTVAYKEMTCEQAAKEKSISKDCYKKRFQRKTAALIDHLDKAGWASLNCPDRYLN
ncbi:hypothetical protein C6A37_04195 [Desulfobacteraceae bacterium SEEP-SAG9]|nr:hypothetical protein C6A37_04195 [Desulfobacteraceae bacterium SEEP-SAG9]